MDCSTYSVHIVDSLDILLGKEVHVALPEWRLVGLGHLGIVEVDPLLLL
jgi:hypothetical protein